MEYIQRKLKELEDSTLLWGIGREKGEKIKAFLAATIDECHSFNDCECDFKDIKPVNEGWEAHRRLVEAKFGKEEDERV